MGSFYILLFHTKFDSRCVFYKCSTCQLSPIATGVKQLSYWAMQKN